MYSSVLVQPCFRLFFSMALMLVYCTTVFGLELALEAEVQLPGDGPWDLQHWMSDSTYGWAQRQLDTGDTIVYRLTLDAPLAYMQIPSELYIGGGEMYLQAAFDIALGRSPSSPFQPLVYCTAKYDDPYSDPAAHFVLAISTIDGSVVGSPIPFFYETNQCSNGEYWIVNVTGLFTWPPPPLSARNAIPVYSTRRYCDGMGHDIESESGFGISIFADFAQTTFAKSSRSDYHVDCAPAGEACDQWGSSAHLQRIVLDGASPNSVTLCADFVDCPLGCDYSSPCPPTPALCAQVDSSGSMRVLLSGGVCTDGDMNDTIWANPLLSGWILSGTILGSSDERFLRWTGQGQGGYFSVFDASNGDSLDITSSILGNSSAYAIKQSNRPADIVTYSPSTRIARVYKQVREVGGLVIQAFGELRELRLSWEPVPTAYRYSIFSSPSENGPWSWIATIDVDEPEFWQIINPTAPRQFYTVTAKY
ncbi:hypothetical protein HZB60_01520 [candidate division KSB1 bacterium]|nr:hypothetical protein [candidate division KSB1 bacterium]